MLNRAILIGHVGKDPEIRSTQSGNRIANFSLATSESWKDKQTGERKEKTDWHNIVCFNEHLIPVIEQYVRKGSRIMVEGKIKTRKWQDQSGNDRWSTEIVLEMFDAKLLLLDRKEGNGGPRAAPADSGEDYGRQQTRSGVGGVGSDLDDEIPFATNTLYRDIILARNRKPRSIV